MAAYTEAIDLDGSDAAFRSNRSAVYMSLNQYEKALTDAEVWILCACNLKHRAVNVCLPSAADPSFLVKHEIRSNSILRLLRSRRGNSDALWL